MKRFLMFAAGMQILAVGVVLNTRSMLGVGCVNTIPYTISELCPLSLGTVTTFVYLFFIGLQILILRKLDIKVLMQLPFSVVFGFFIDLYVRLICIVPTNLQQRGLILIAAIWCTALGVFLMVESDYVLNPGDGVVHAVCRVSGKPFGSTKMCVDLCMVAMAACIGLLGSGRIIGIGAGTVLSAIFVGKCIGFFKIRFANH